MQNTLRRSLLLLSLVGLVVTGCEKKEVDELEGNAPTADFTYVVDESQYPVVVTFTNTSTDGFLYQWDFGDGSPLVSGKNVTHAYTLPRTYTVKLTVAGRGGSTTSAEKTEHQVIVKSLCNNNAFSVLTNCGSTGTGSWTYSDQPGAIVRLAADGTTVNSSSTTLSECQGDDQFVFTNGFSYTYDGQVNCGARLDFTTGFIFRPNGNLGQLILQRSKSFIGLTDTVQNKTYDILEASPGKVRLQSTNFDGTKTVVTLVPTPEPIVLAERQLTGGSSRTWMLDETEASTVRVGTEAEPGTYYDSMDDHSTACQYDDEYTFTSSRNFIYDAKATTFVAFAYACQAPRSLNTTFTFGPASGTGVADVVLGNATAFIGVTNSAPDHVYRILSINNRKMVLRAKVADATGAVIPDQYFTLKLRVK
jgi:PKD repeat protein